MSRIIGTGPTWQQKAATWVVDYSAARDRAIGWLGDRYLLATPVRRRASSRASPPHSMRMTPEGRPWTQAAQVASKARALSQ
jgi:hypothetical protein